LEDTNNVCSRFGINIPEINMNFLPVYLVPQDFINSSKISLNILAIIVDAPPKRSVSSAN
jgi:hypothetical protein